MFQHVHVHLSVEKWPVSQSFIHSYTGFILQFCVQIITLCILTSLFFMFDNSCYCLPTISVFLGPLPLLQAVAFSVITIDSAKRLYSNFEHTRPAIDSRGQ